MVSPIPQRYNLKAIHNEKEKTFGINRGVTNTSKIQSESNSQRPTATGQSGAGCHQYLKDTIWKQFTTYYALPPFLGKVSPIPQRYNLKAIHNSSSRTWTAGAGVTNTSKIQSESNSQQYGRLLATMKRCHQYLKDTIWKQFTTDENVRLTAWICGCHQYLKDTIWKRFKAHFQLFHYLWEVSPIPQRYNLKAIHNRVARRTLFPSGVTNTSKIQSESNSQRYWRSYLSRYWCHQYLKDTIWKQFTTYCSDLRPSHLVSPIPQRYNLKAIHNNKRVFINR